MKKGFTLVELSIVLVIIGLLIVGILVAQSMISTSKIEAGAMQIGQFDAAVENFKTRYNSLPGDSPGFGGDGNGVINLRGTGNWTDQTQNAFDCEIANFWTDAMPDQFPAQTVCNLPAPGPSTSGPNKRYPLAKFGSAGALFVAASQSYNTYYADSTDAKNYYVVMSALQGQPADPTYGALFSATNATNSATKPSDLLALDTKIDDGSANSGSVTSGGIGTVQIIDAINPAAGLCSSGSSYELSGSHDRYECTPFIRIGAIAGDTQ